MTAIYQNKTLKGFDLINNQEELFTVLKAYQTLLAYSPSSLKNIQAKEKHQLVKQKQFAIYPFAYAMQNKLNSAYISDKTGSNFYQMAFAITASGQNKPASYWLWRYLTSFEAQYALALTKGSPSRLDVLALNNAESPQLYQHYLALLESEHTITTKTSQSRIIDYFGEYLSNIKNNAQSLQGNVPEVAIKLQVKHLIKELTQIQNHYGRAPIITQKSANNALLESIK